MFPKFGLVCPRPKPEVEIVNVHAEQARPNTDSQRYKLITT